jgi:hypothetical protein
MGSSGEERLELVERAEMDDLSIQKAGLDHRQLVDLSIDCRRVVRLEDERYNLRIGGEIELSQIAGEIRHPDRFDLGDHVGLEIVLGFASRWREQHEELHFGSPLTLMSSKQEAA